MSYILVCPACRTEVLPELDTKTNKVFCPNCQKEIEVNQFQVGMIKTADQLLRGNPSQESFTIECQGCRKISRPIHTKEGKLKCSNCAKEPLHLAGPYLEMLKSHIPKTATYDTCSPPKVIVRG